MCPPIQLKAGARSMRVQGVSAQTNHDDGSARSDTVDKRAREGKRRVCESRENAGQRGEVSNAEIVLGCH